MGVHACTWTTTTIVTMGVFKWNDTEGLRAIDQGRSTPIQARLSYAAADTAYGCSPGYEPSSWGTEIPKLRDSGLRPCVDGCARAFETAAHADGNQAGLRGRRALQGHRAGIIARRTTSAARRSSPTYATSTRCSRAFDFLRHLLPLTKGQSRFGALLFFFHVKAASEFVTLWRRAVFACAFLLSSHTSELYGGIRRILEFSTVSSTAARSVTIYHPSGRPCDRMVLRRRASAGCIPRRRARCRDLQQSADYTHVRRARTRQSVSAVSRVSQIATSSSCASDLEDFWPRKGRMLRSSERCRCRS